VNRRRFTAVALGVGLSLPLAAVELGRTEASDASSPLPDRPLVPPLGGLIRTAFAVGPGVNVIDVSGPWETFQDAAIAGGAAQFELFTVAERRGMVEASGRLRLAASFSYETAPRADMVVVPAHEASPATLEWLRAIARHADLVMSVCTGAFIVADTGLLDGLTATTHHGSYDDFAARYPHIRLLRHRRFVEHERVATAGGLTSGIDLALRVVERYLGRDAAAATSDYMEYERSVVRVA
jgi:transcriptional regulator GlxA family with amidase domain